MVEIWDGGAVGDWCNASNEGSPLGVIEQRYPEANSMVKHCRNVFRVYWAQPSLSYILLLPTSPRIANHVSHSRR